MNNNNAVMVRLLTDAFMDFVSKSVRFMLLELASPNPNSNPNLNPS